MLQSKNKTTGDRLSVIPQFTLNSTVSWQVRDISPYRAPSPGMAARNRKRFNYKGEAVSGSELNEVIHTALLG
nr:TonB-dependent receptor [Raoultella sp. NCTC 9187]